MAVPAIFEQLAERLPDGAYKTVNVRGGFTSIDAYHILERLTDTFQSLCGHRFGIHVDEFQHHDKCVAAIGYLWYKLPDGDDTVYKVPAVGEGQQRGGSVADAMKMAQTNLMSKAASYIGIGLSIYKGQHIDAPILSACIEVQAVPITPATLNAVMAANPADIEAVTAGKKTTPEQLTEAEGRHLQAVLEFADLIVMADDGAARRDKWLQAHDVAHAGEVDISAINQVIRSMRQDSKK